jgi:hypothetical protein
MWNGGGKVKRQSSEAGWWLDNEADWWLDNEAGWWQGQEAELGEKVGGKVGRQNWEGRAGGKVRKGCRAGGK